MKIKLFSTILLPVLMLCFASCDVTVGKGPLVEKEYELEEFSGIELDGSFKVTVNQGTDQRAVVLTNENIHEKLRLQVMDGILYVSLEPGSYLNYELSINLTVPTVDRIVLLGSGDISIGTFVGLNDLHVKLDGSGDIVSEGALEVSGTTQVNLNGSGDIDLKLKASDVEARMNGSGDIELQGSTMKLAASLNGSGDIKAFKLESMDCEADLDGSGSIKVFATKNLEAAVRGSGEIRYKGKPSVRTTIDGSGSVDAD